MLYGKEPVHFVHILGRLAYLCFEARDLNTAISHTVRKLKILTKYTNENTLVHKDALGLIEFFENKKETTTEKEIEDKIKYSINIGNYFQTVLGQAGGVQAQPKVDEDKVLLEK